MFVVPHTSAHRSLPLSERAEGKGISFVPMVYERIDETPVQWEYHVLSIDTREQELPNAATLNELGAKGWILASVVEQRENRRVHFYFVRQSA